MKYPLSDIWLTDLERGYVIDALDHGFISGVCDYVKRFESALAAQVGRQFGIAVSNGTVALQVALKALGVKPGDEVIVPAFTFAAPAAAAAFIGAVPVLVDIDPVTWTLDAQLVKEAVNSRTKAIIAVDLLGHPADYDALYAAVGRIPIIEDAAQAHGAKYKDVPCGKHGLISTFSFHANKAITCGEGGAILTDQPALAETIRRIVHHGMIPGKGYLHDVVGTNARMPNLSAAIGLGQVERWDELIRARIDVDKLYRKHLTGVQFRKRAKWATPSCCLSVLTSKNKDSILRSLRNSDLADARSVWVPLNELGLYEARYEYPISKQIADQTLLLPTYGRLTEEDVLEMAERVQAAVATSEAA